MNLTPTQEMIRAKVKLACQTELAESLLFILIGSDMARCNYRVERKGDIVDMSVTTPDGDTIKAEGSCLPDVIDALNDAMHKYAQLKEAAKTKTPPPSIN